MRIASLPKEKEIHIIPQPIEEAIHAFSIECQCNPFLEIVSYALLNQEDTYYYHNLFLPCEDLIMREEVEALRTMVQKLQEKTESLEVTQKKNQEAIEYLELIQSDYLKSPNEKSIIEITLDKLRG